MQEAESSLLFHFTGQLF